MSSMPSITVPSAHCALGTGLTTIGTTSALPV